MNSDNPAKLTGALLVQKGNAAPSHGVMARPESVGGRPGFADPRPVHAVPASAAKPAVKPVAKPVDGSGRRIGVTLRLDPARHLRLRLAAAHLGLNKQEIMLAALDSYLDRIGGETLDGNCFCLARDTET